MVDRIYLDETPEYADIMTAKADAVQAKVAAEAAAAVATELLPPGVECAIWGDSRLAQGFLSGTATTRSARGLPFWIQALTKGAVRFPADLNFAVAGQTTQGLIDGGQLAACAASRAAIVLVCVGTNDAATDGSAAATRASYLTAAMAFKAAGKAVIWIAETPRGNTFYTPDLRLTANQLLAHNGMRDWILRVLPSLSPKFVAVDIYPAIADLASATGDVLLDDAFGRVTRDGLHPAMSGAYSIALQCLPAFQKLVAPSTGVVCLKSDLYNATHNPYGNLIGNGRMEGSAGTKPSGWTGDLADNWAGIETGMSGGTWSTRAFSKVANDRGDWQQIDIEGTSNSTGTQLVHIYRRLTLGNVAAGDVLEGYGEFEFDSSQGLKGWGLSVVIGGVNTRADDGMGSGGYGNFPAAAVQGSWFTPPIVVPASGITYIELRASCEVQVSSTIDIAVRCKDMVLKKVL